MNRRDLIVIFIVVLTDLIGFGIVIPLLPTISSQYDITGFKLGLLVSAYPLAQFFAAPILGLLSDRYGRKPILVISKLGTVVAYVIFAYAQSFPLLLLSKLIDGATGGNISAARAYISDITTKDNRSRGMAVIGIGFGLGFIIGPAIGGIFYSLGGSVVLPALVGALLCLVSAVITQVFLEDRAKPVNLSKFSLLQFLSVFAHPEIKSVLFVQFLLMLALSSFQTTFSFFTNITYKIDTQQNSYILVYLGLLSFLIQGFMVRHRFSHPVKQTKIGLGLMAIGIVLVAFSPTVWFMLLSLVVYLVGSALVGVLLPTILSNTSSTDPEGQIQGAFESIGSLARVIGPAVAGAFITSHTRLIYSCLSIILISSILFLSRSTLVD